MELYFWETPVQPVLAHNKGPWRSVSLQRRSETAELGKHHGLHEKGTRRPRGRVLKNSQIWGLVTLMILHLGNSLSINVSDKSTEHYKETNLTTQHFTNSKKIQSTKRKFILWLSCNTYMVILISTINSNLTKIKI